MSRLLGHTVEKLKKKGVAAKGKCLLIICSVFVHARMPIQIWQRKRQLRELEKDKARKGKKKRDNENKIEF